MISDPDPWDQILGSIFGIHEHVWLALADGESSSDIVCTEKKCMLATKLWFYLTIAVIHFRPWWLSSTFALLEDGGHFDHQPQVFHEILSKVLIGSFRLHFVASFYHSWFSS